MLRYAHLALTFLTTLPLPDVGEVREGEFKKASGFYPLAGYAVGLVLFLVLLLGQFFPAGVSGALALTAWLWITGMLHFDGLVDAGDALLVMKSPQKRLEILKDVHIGAFGLAVAVVALLFKWSLLTELHGHKWTTLFPLVLVPAIARFSVLIPMNLFPAAREESLGARSREGWWQMGLLLILPVLVFPGGWWMLLAGMLSALLVARFAAGRLGGGINGDVYGAIIECTEIAVLLLWVLVSGGHK
ncbi:adenosylcobinamide-GDP ribazoletransferase [Deinococcus roseus]|uniref:Adenosylcobinamide-GDP ribazoletransferase n=1 Tax=Deinococcus roseus TaxID=392414 RepID=A0ABQ2D2H5_9DEIO|nr:adenosylcobinamide-GDP ribazoletransferase [Deinococcus roseus]GGJ38305.1 adenosylcobinamide-GDP ribazoletransferase [Deinococcus roseus]